MHICILSAELLFMIMHISTVTTSTVCICVKRYARPSYYVYILCACGHMFQHPHYKIASYTYALGASPRACVYVCFE